MKKFFLTVIICLVSCIAFSQKVFEFTPACEAAYKEIIKLKIDTGKQLIEQARKENPNNLIPDLLDGYIDFFVLFFNEDPAEYNARKGNFDKRLKAFDEGPQNNPFYRYCKALIYLQRAGVRIKFGERYSAGWDFKKANSLIKENRSKYKSFQLNNLVSGPVKVAIGTVPKAYKWVTSLLGLKGSISEGMQLMRNLLNSNDSYAKLFSNEATFYYCYLMFYIENRPDEVFKYIQTKKLDVVQNHLFAYMAANLAINSKRNDYAKNIIQNRSQSPGYLSTPVWNFELGYLYLHKLELDDAIFNLEKFINDFKGNFYLKDALQKISWAYYLKGDIAGAERFRLLCIKNGNTETDADKKAYKDAKSKVWPHEVLLKARILNDGGYNKEALALLQDKNINDFTKTEEALEFSYRLARINDDLGRDNEAIQFYQTAIRLGKNRQEYYAARAALQIGYIYEKRGQKSLAIAAFQQCIDMEDHEYKDSLDQRAKAGIARCKGE
ncbi:MAG: tetratricopeptide repeat protein [Segetibacter sp.]|nr:tetratricopeptide repeat protein [Segetibacter sp.]